jgi:hypothetical protein
MSPAEAAAYKMMHMQMQVMHPANKSSSSSSNVRTIFDASAFAKMLAVTDRVQVMYWQLHHLPAKPPHAVLRAAS